MTEEVQGEEVVEEVPPIICERCGHLAEQKIIKVSETDKKAYLRSILGGIPFVKEYSGLDGNFKITLQELTAYQTDFMMDCIRSLTDTDNILKQALQIKFLMLCKSLSIGERASFTAETVWEDVKEIRIKSEEDGEPDKIITVAEQLVSYFEDNVAKVTPSIMMGLIDKIMVDFTKLSNSFLDEALDEDFWKGAGRG